jgi:hypothetical protein
MSWLARLFGGDARGRTRLRATDPYFSEGHTAPARTRITLNANDDNDDDVCLLDPSQTEEFAGPGDSSVNGMPPRRERASQRPQLTLVQRMTQSPFAKYKEHRRIPYKFLLHLLVGERGEEQGGGALAHVDWDPSLHTPTRTWPIVTRAHAHLAASAARCRLWCC